MWIRKEDYARESREFGGKTYMKKQKLPTHMKTTYDYYCPVLCQQKENGSYGKKTFNGKKCCEIEWGNEVLRCLVCGDRIREPTERQTYTARIIDVD